MLRARRWWMGDRKVKPKAPRFAIKFDTGVACFANLKIAMEQ